jgi:hypothetical protein
MKKALKKLRRWNVPQHNKGYIYNKPIANIVLNGGKTEVISSKVQNKTRVSTLPTVIQHSTRIHSKGIKKEKEIKWIHIGKKSNYPYLQMI